MTQNNFFYKTYKVTYKYRYMIDAKYDCSPIKQTLN